MKVTGINHNSGTVRFQGITQRIPQITINTAQDLHNQYRYFRYARYYEALDDSIYPKISLSVMKIFHFFKEFLGI